MSTSGMPTAVKHGSTFRERAGAYARARAARTGRPPRRAYEHYFIESEGLHSRIHLQNFWSTFWPQVDEPATARIRAFDAGGTPLGQVERVLPPFNSMFLELRDLLGELGADATEGTVAIDLEPPRGVRGEFGELPKPDSIEIKTPYWMAFYDDAENYMYVHSIELLRGETFGAPWILNLHERNVAEGEPWRSWRLLEVDNLTELQVVVINHSPDPRSSSVGIHTADDPDPIWSEALEFAPRQLHRVRVPAGELAGWRDRVAELPLVRIGVDPLLTGNGKPYVLLRYGDGPLSLHHG